MTTGPFSSDDLDDLHRSLAHDVDPEVFAAHAARFRLQSAAMLSAPVTAPLRSHPTTYVVCTQDAAIPPSAQEAMARPAGRIDRLESSHCPMWSMPGRVADLLDTAGSN